MKTMASSLNEMRRYGINTYEELELKLKRAASDRQQLLDRIKQAEKEMKSIYSVIENKNTLSKNQQPVLRINLTILFLVSYLVFLHMYIKLLFLDKKFYIFCRNMYCTLFNIQKIPTNALLGFF